MKIYIGCSLTQAPEDFKQQVERLKDALCEDYEILEFLGVEAGTPEDVYQRDINECVATCDAFIAICDYPAIGLGYEVAVAVEKLGKPTLALAHTNTHVSRLLLGMPHENYMFKRYQTEDGAVELIQRFLGNVDTKL